MRERVPDAVLLDISMDDMDGWATARRLRSQHPRPDGATAMPIIMVSVNAFENQPDKLAEVGAQAFVDKPVIESALRVALQRHLQLECLADLAVPGWGAPAAAPAPVPPDAAPLPGEAAATLTRLARLGHAQGLHQALDRLAAEHPGCAARVAELRALAERFAFSDLLAALRRDLATDEDDDLEAEVA